MSTAVISTTYLEALRTNRWYAGLDPAICAEIEALGRVQRCRRGEAIYLQGDKPNGFYAVLEGRVRLSSSSQEGREFVIALLGPGAWFGEASSLDGLPRDLDAFAETAATLLVMAPDELEALLRRHNALCRALLAFGSRRQRLVFEWTIMVATRPLEARLAFRLAHLASGPGPYLGPPKPLDVRISQETLARMMGVTRQRVNQLLAQWQAEGLVTPAFGRIVVNDVARLAAIAD